MARTILSQYDFEKALEERIEQIKPLLKQHILLEDNEEEVLKIAEQIAERKAGPLLRKLEEKDHLIFRQATEIDLLEGKLRDLERQIPHVISKESKYSTLES